jgi:flagellar protein FlbD
MIHVTRLNHSSLVLNSDLIEQIEATPDTVISLVNGERFMVLETPDEVVDRVVTFRRSLSHPRVLEISGTSGPSEDTNGKP